MILSEIGIIAHDSWQAIPSHFSLALLDEFIIMPDHIHGIIIIKSSVQTPKLGVSTKTPKLGVATNKTEKSGNPYWKSNSIGSIINQFKRICTITTKTNGLDLTWQPRYWDHIIRSGRELNRIRKYIMNNPQNWNNKKVQTSNLGVATKTPNLGVATKTPNLGVASIKSKN
jgi:REP element-mobilizing transposase RayT